MLSALSDLVLNASGSANNDFEWHSLALTTLQDALPFWDRRDLQRVSTNLREKGVILIASAPLLQSDDFKFAFNEKLQSDAHHKTQTPIAGTIANGKNFIASQWQPNQTTLDQLAQLSIPNEFALRQVPEFVVYWRERKIAHKSWGQKFISHTLQRWRNFEEREHRKNKAKLIPSAWAPMESTVISLQDQNIPREFIFENLKEFITYRLQSGDRELSWDSKFIQNIQNRWADAEARKNVSSKEFPIFPQWRPSADAIEVMTEKSDIPLSFIEDAIAEFIIYWQEKGTTNNTWNSLFIKHVRLQWHRYQHALDNAMEPRPIATNWQPSVDIFDILKLANIDANFARELVPEFVLYWKDRNEVHRSWNTRFLQHIKRTWAARHQLSSGQAQSKNNRSTREISLEEILTDRSWAE